MMRWSDGRGLPVSDILVVASIDDETVLAQPTFEQGHQCQADMLSANAFDSTNIVQTLFETKSEYIDSC